MSKTAKQTKSSNKPWQFQPGQSGNPNGRPKKEQCFTDLLREALRQKTKAGTTVAEEVIKVWTSRMQAGDLRAIQEAWDRIEGKPAQRIEADVRDMTFSRIEERVRISE